MTNEEHDLMILLLSRINQQFGAIYEMLKSRDILTAADIQAFHFVSWDDNRQIVAAAAQARSDYLKLAKLAGVEVPQDI